MSSIDFDNLQNVVLQTAGESDMPELDLVGETDKGSSEVHAEKKHILKQHGEAEHLRHTLHKHGASKEVGHKVRKLHHESISHNRRKTGHMAPPDLTDFPHKENGHTEEQLNYKLNKCTAHGVLAHVVDAHLGRDIDHTPDALDPATREVHDENILARIHTAKCLATTNLDEVDPDLIESDVKHPALHAVLICKSCDKDSDAAMHATHGMREDLYQCGKESFAAAKHAEVHLGAFHHHIASQSGETVEVDISHDDAHKLLELSEKTKKMIEKCAQHLTAATAAKASRKLASALTKKMDHCKEHEAVEIKKTPTEWKKSEILRIADSISDNISDIRKAIHEEAEAIKDCVKEDEKHSDFAQVQGASHMCLCMCFSHLTDLARTVYDSPLSLGKDKA